MKKIEDKFVYQTKYVRSNIFAGKNKFQYLIKYDNQASVYNLTFNIDNLNDYNNLVKKIKKVNKDIIVSYNNKILSIVGSVTNKKYLPEMLNPILEVLNTYFEENECFEVCKHCKNKKTSHLTDNDGEINYFCNDCYNEFSKTANYKKDKYKETKENLFLGMLGSIIGVIPGILLWCILSYVNVDPSISGLIIATGATLGYKNFSKNIKLPGIVLNTIISLIAVFIALELGSTIYLYTQYKSTFQITLFDAYKAIPYYLKTITEFEKLFNNQLLSSYILTMISLFTTFSLNYQKVHNYDIKRLGDK